MATTTDNHLAMAERMRTIGIHDDVIEDLIGVKPAVDTDLQEQAAVDDGDDAEPITEALESDEECIAIET